MTVFEYSGDPEPVLDEKCFVLNVPNGITSKVDLFSTLASAGQFPGYFGGNWDALLDCLRDLSWIDSKEVVVSHSDVPLRDTPSDCRVYLELLRTALSDWSRPPRVSAVDPTAECPCVEHELRVIFPSKARGTVARLLNGES